MSSLPTAPLRVQFVFLLVALFGFLGGSLGAVVSLSLVSQNSEGKIICPPLVDAAIRVDLIYESGQAPKPTELDYEFAEACGFIKIRDPIKIGEPPPEKGT